MTLTTVVGSSGSGKTTFLNDVHKSYKCIYIRQYHNMRPYIAVSKIPNFDPTNLPYWKTYEKEGKAETIQVGGTMAGEFTAGLSGGQRKLLLFELIRQRVKNQSELLIVLDEPFAGVTDDFVPFIVERLEEMRQKHNIVLVTNDHVETLTKMADNTITVSAIDRTTVKINQREKVDRTKAIAALSVGERYVYDASTADLKFFMEVEVYKSAQIMGVTIFTIFSFLMILLAFWDSDESSAALVLVAASIIAFFCVNPYLLSLVEWRIYMREEAEALVHSSKGMNKFMKTNVTLFMIVVISLLEYGFINAVVSGLEDIKFWVGMLFDSASMTFPVIALGIFTNLPFHLVEIVGFLPFIFMIFFSTTFSPGSGVPGLKALRYLFSRFYFWCMVPGVKDDMEGCPDENLNILYLILSALLGVFLFLIVDIGIRIKKRGQKKKSDMKLSSMLDSEFQELMVELYGEKGLRRFQHMSSTHHSRTSPSTHGDTSGSVVHVTTKTVKNDQNPDEFEM
jgi:ABC-type lipoprotein export system ATPase subunit